MKTEELIVISTAGKPYGHAPEQYYHDVDVYVLRKDDGRWFVNVLETWGNHCRGHDEEHGRRQISGQGKSLEDALAQVERLAQAAGINREYLEEAVCEAVTEVEELLME